MIQGMRGDRCHSDAWPELAAVMCKHEVYEIYLLEQFLRRSHMARLSMLARRVNSGRLP